MIDKAEAFEVQKDLITVLTNKSEMLDKIRKVSPDLFEELFPDDIEELDLEIDFLRGKLNGEIDYSTSLEDYKWDLENPDPEHQHHSNSEMGDEDWEEK